MIAFFILPQTSSITSGLFRTLFEVASWKIVFAVLGTLLWSTALHDFEVKGNNFITLLALTLILALSVLLTPLVVRNLISGTLSNIASQTTGLAAVGLSAGLASPATLANLARKGTTRGFSWGARAGLQGAKVGVQGARSAPRVIKNQFTKHLKVKSQSHDRESQ